jgi:perosamine synthetase
MTANANTLIPYGRQSITEDDIQAVVDVLHSDWLTTGPLVNQFETAFARHIGVKRAVAVSSGTAALHSAMYAAGIGPGDEVIVPTMTFAATANSVVFQGGTPVFADVCPDTLLLNPADVEHRITSRTKAIVAVDFAGQPCDYDTLKRIADYYGLMLIADACHALGAEYKGGKAGALTDMTVFSFHPVKHITTGEGGMITTANDSLADKMRIFRNHGITSDHRERTNRNTWFYEMVDLGYNYRITDFQCALGLSQLNKLDTWLKRRDDIARRYRAALKTLPGIKPLAVSESVRHAWHLYVIRCMPEVLMQHDIDRDLLFSLLRQRGIGCNVHYTPVHLHPYYREKFGYQPGDYPVAESAYGQILSLPMYHGLKGGEQQYVITALMDIISGKPHPVSQAKENGLLA